MKVNLAYGSGYLTVDLPKETTVIEPSPRPGLADERSAVIAAFENPLDALPLRKSIRPTDRVTIIFTDITRATPNHRLIPWLLEHLAGVVPRENITLFNSLGTHRSNTRAELETLLTPEVVANYRVVQNESENLSAYVQLGTTRDGAPALIHRHVAEADFRIVTGFIEPHFFAGFSGGPKGILPGAAHLTTIKSNHGPRNIEHPNAAFGITEGNPIWEEMRDVALRAGPLFLLNVALNESKEITGVFGGSLVAAHKAGIEFVRKTAMQAVPELFDVVVTTNSGYPLDMTLYQGVKGMSAGARVVKQGGTLILAAECREGMPANCPMDKFLRSAGSPEEVLAQIASSSVIRPEQWQAQLKSLIHRRARVMVHSSLADEIVQAAHLLPCRDIAATVRQTLLERGPGARVAVLPHGPLTIPYYTGPL